MLIFPFAGGSLSQGPRHRPHQALPRGPQADSDHARCSRALVLPTRDSHVSRVLYSGKFGLLNDEGLCSQFQIYIAMP